MSIDNIKGANIALRQIDLAVLELMEANPAILQQARYNPHGLELDFLQSIERIRYGLVEVMVRVQNYQSAKRAS